MRQALIAATCLLILVSLPHTVEDFQYGALARFGVTVPLGVATLVIMYSVQLIALRFVLVGSSRAALVLALTGAVWCVGALLIHGHELIYTDSSYRHGAVSKLLEVLIILFGAVVAASGMYVASARTAEHHVQKPKSH